MTLPRCRGLRFPLGHASISRGRVSVTEDVARRHRVLVEFLYTLPKAGTTMSKREREAIVNALRALVEYAYGGADNDAETHDVA
jgi:ribosomal protein L17